MRLTEFWARMDGALGPAYAKTWAETQVIAEFLSQEDADPAEAHPTPKPVVCG